MPSSPFGDIASSTQVPLAIHGERHVTGTDPMGAKSVSPSMRAVVPFIDAQSSLPDPIPTGTNFTVSWDDAVVNQKVATFWTSGTNFVIPIGWGGLYYVTAYLSYFGNYEGGTERRAWINLHRWSSHADLTIAMTTILPLPTGESDSLQMSGVFMGVQDDQISLRGRHDAGVSIESPFTNARMSMAYLGTFTTPPVFPY